MFYSMAILVLVLLAVATACDLRTREVPDGLSISIAGVALMAAMIGWHDISVSVCLTGGAIGLAVGYAMFRFAKFGGADAKLIAALGFVVGPVGLLVVLFGMAITGGALSLIAWKRGKTDFAYVPAITAGFVGYVGLASMV
jgi:prepilin peptidase CpaA